MGDPPTFLSLEEEEERRYREGTWSIIAAGVPELDRPDWRPPMPLMFASLKREHESLLAIEELRQRRALSATHFFTPVSLLRIIEEPEVWKEDVPDGPCVYVFVSFRRRAVLKVGETGEGVPRIADDHLRRGADTSTVKGWYEWTLRPWPASIGKDEITLLIFTLPTRSRSPRLALERGLDRLLKPEINRKKRGKKA